jgi:7-keto-8-aminopelargonate synthetase-like enzyme
MANIGVLPCLVGQKDRLLMDELVHASLHDGARLSGAKTDFFRHNDVKDMEKRLDEGGAGRTVVVVEGLYSMDGDLAPLQEIQSQCRKRGAVLLVDEAHATGVLGKSGRGTFEHLDIDLDETTVVTGTLSKALGSLGGFVACGRELRELLINKSRSFLFATALPPASAAAALAAIRLIQELPGVRKRLWENVRLLASVLKINAASPIVPWIVGSAGKAVALQDKLWERGFYVPAIRPPTVPRNRARLRISLMWNHTKEQIEGLANALVAFDGK